MGETPVDFREPNADSMPYSRLFAHVSEKTCEALTGNGEVVHFTRMELDATDKQLLAALQRDAHLTSEALGQLLNLSQSQAGRRRHRLEAAGLIEGYTVRLCPKRLGLSVQAFVQVQMASHDADQVAGFARTVAMRAEIVSAWTLTGEADYLLRIYAEDLSALNELIQKVLLPHPAVARVQSQIVMDQFKADAPLPT